MTETIGYILTGMCLIGTVLNCKRIAACFIVWMFANIGWTIYDINTDQTYRAILDIVQFITAIWGYIEWSKKEKELKERVMLLINNYRTPNKEILNDRCKEYLKCGCGRGSKNYNINKIKRFKDIPDGVEILIDYVDVSALRIMYIPTEIIYESIYRELPELFEE